MKKAIVTGANGFFGTALCRELSQQGVEVTALVRSDDSDVSGIKGLKGLKIICCDMSKVYSLTDCKDCENADAFFHFAWEGSAGVLRGDENVQIDNIKYTMDALKLCKAINCKRFVFAASIMEFEIMAAVESNTGAGINNLYSAAKLSADYMTRILAQSLGVDYIRCIISNIYGPGEKSPRLINTSIRKLLAGEHCAFSPGEQLYDFIYADDAAAAFAAAAKTGKTNTTYYIGSSPRPLKEYLLKMRDIVAPDAEIGLGEINFSGVSLTYKEFDTNALKKDTGFENKISFEEGIKRTAEWIKETENGRI